MNKITYLLACLGEECGELQQMVGKNIRFGVNEMYPKLDKTNWERLREEYHDVVATYEAVCQELGRSCQLDNELLDAKTDRIIKYMKFSRKLSILKEKEG